MYAVITLQLICSAFAVVGIGLALWTKYTENRQTPAFDIVKRMIENGASVQESIDFFEDYGLDDPVVMKLVQTEEQRQELLAQLRKLSG